MRHSLKSFFVLTLLSALVSFYCEARNSKQLERIKKANVKNVSDLKQITPFNTISIIQKRYLPKTYRAEINLSVSSIVNNHFFHLLGGGGHIGFFLREDHGFGLEAYFMHDIHKMVTTDLIRSQNILPYNLITSKNYYGAFYKWSPVFGKFAVADRKIAYFDTYFTFGGGVTQVGEGVEQGIRDLVANDIELPTPSQQSFPTGSIGVGQVFALSKNFAINWGIKWNFFFYQLNEDSNRFFQDDFIMSLGFNYYFPGATYR